MNIWMAMDCEANEIGAGMSQQWESRRNPLGRVA